jgi:hypothetical protein
MNDFYKAAMAAAVAKKVAEAGTLSALRQHEKESKARAEAEMKAAAKAAAKAKHRELYGPSISERVGSFFGRIIKWRDLLVFWFTMLIIICTGIILAFA